MNINTRTLWTTLAAVVLVAVGLVTLSAQTQEPPRGRRERMGESRGFGPGRGPGPVLARLNLTEQQREQVRAIMQENRASGDAPAHKVGELQRELKAAIAEAEAAALGKRIEVDLKIAQVLTAEQRAQAREMPAPGGGRGPRRGLT
jgi:Spy/CpxP family protein refolding chaperone